LAFGYSSGELTEIELDIEVGESVFSFIIISHIEDDELVSFVVEVEEIESFVGCVTVKLGEFDIMVGAEVIVVYVSCSVGIEEFEIVGGCVAVKVGESVSSFVWTEETESDGDCVAVKVGESVSSFVGTEVKETESDGDCVAVKVGESVDSFVGTEVIVKEDESSGWLDGVRVGWLVKNLKRKSPSLPCTVDSIKFEFEALIKNSSINRLIIIVDGSKKRIFDKMWQ